MSMSDGVEIDLTVDTVLAAASFLCSLLTAYTVIGILDHERWMKVSNSILLDNIHSSS